MQAPVDSSLAVFEEVVGVESLFGRDPRAMFEISNASSEEKMHALVARAMFAECPALTSVVTMLRRSPGERLVLRSHYNEGVWDPYHVGFQAPLDVSHTLDDVLLTVKKPIIRSVDPETFTVEWWFREPYYCIVPIFSVDSAYVEGCLALGSKREIPDVRGLIAYTQVVCGAISFAWERIGRLEDAVRIGQKIEREHVLQTVHDSAVQDVFAAEMALGDVLGEAGLSASCEAGVHKALDHVRQANRSLRTVLASDDPPLSQNESFLRDLLEAETSRHLSEGGAPVDSVIDERCMLPSFLTEPCRMFIREALRNVRKHACASHVVVMGAVRDGILLLTVHDDGRGPSPTDGPESGSIQADHLPHFGIANLKAVVHELGGTVQFDSQPGEGSALRMRVPLSTIREEPPCR